MLLMLARGGSIKLPSNTSKSADCFYAFVTTPNYKDNSIIIKQQHFKGCFVHFSLVYKYAVGR